MVADEEERLGKKLTWQEKQMIGPAEPGQTTAEYIESLKPEERERYP